MIARAVERALLLADGQAFGCGWVLWETLFGYKFKRMTNPMVVLPHR